MPPFSEATVTRVFALPVRAVYIREAISSGISRATRGLSHIAKPARVSEKTGVERKTEKKAKAGSGKRARRRASLRRGAPGPAGASEEVTAPLGAPLADSEPAVTRCARRPREAPAPPRPPEPPPPAETFQLLPPVVTAPAPPSWPSLGSLEEANSAASVCLTVFEDREAPPRREAKVPVGSPPRAPSPPSAPRPAPPPAAATRSVAHAPPRLLIASGLLGLAALVFLGALTLLGGPRAPAPGPVAAAELDGPVLHSVWLTSSPSGAEVFEGAERLGRTPLKLSRQLGARAQVRLLLPGRRPVERSLGFFRDDEVSVAFDDDGVRR